MGVAVAAPKNERKHIMILMQGTIKSGGAYNVNSKKGPQIMVSFNLVDEVGNTFACQMWADDPQQAQLAQVIDHARRRRVQCTVSGYTVRMRKNQDGSERPQANFVVSDVTIEGLLQVQQVVTP
jgi:hypothetical protein